jgi:hypothetical protein
VSRRPDPDGRARCSGAGSPREPRLHAGTVGVVAARDEGRQSRARGGTRRDDERAEAKAQIDAWTDVARHSSAHRTIAARRIDEIGAQVGATEREVVDSSSSVSLEMSAEQLRDAWSKLIRAGGTVSRNYLHQLVERIEIADDRITTVPRNPTAPV